MQNPKTRVARFFAAILAKNIPINQEIYQMATKYNKFPKNRGHKIYQPLPLQDPKRFTQIWIFELKIYHLATLPKTGFSHTYTYMYLY
jgi:hypothetical protein